MPPAPSKETPTERIIRLQEQVKGLSEDYKEICTKVDNNSRQNEGIRAALYGHDSEIGILPNMSSRIRDLERTTKDIKNTLDEWKVKTDKFIWAIILLGITLIGTTIYNLIVQRTIEQLIK